jgi:hypothetical protein
MLTLKLEFGREWHSLRRTVTGARSMAFGL